MGMNNDLHVGTGHDDRRTMEHLDPYTSYLGFCYDDPTGGGCVGRVYFWYDPAFKLPAVDDDDFRVLFPEIDDEEWARLYYEAFDRHGTYFHTRLLEEEGLTEENAPEDWLQFLALDRIFGPRPPRTDKEHEPGAR